MIFVDDKQQEHDRSTKGHATNIRITSTTRHQKCFSTRSDQGSIVLTFTLVLLVLKRFLGRVMLVILMFVV